MNIPLSWFVNFGSSHAVDISNEDLNKYLNEAIERCYKVGFLKKGDIVSTKTNKLSFTITRYRKS